MSHFFKKKLIIDHDGGIEDFPAFSLQLCSDITEVHAITVCPADSYKEPAVKATKRIVDYLRYKNILIAEGDLEGINPFPDKWRKDSYKVANLELLKEAKEEPSNKVSPLSAYEVLAKMISGDESYIMLVTGPMSNLAQALKKKPSIKNKIEHLYIMGGAVNAPGNVNQKGHDGSAEWNIYNNPKAADVVISSGIPITMIPLDATNYTPLTKEFMNRLNERSHFRTSRLLSQIWGLVSKYIEKETYYFWDTLTSMSILQPEVIMTKKMKIKVVLDGSSQGRTVESDEGTLIDVAIKADKDLLEDLILQKLRI